MFTISLLSPALLRYIFFSIPLSIPRPLNYVSEVKKKSKEHDIANDGS